MVVGIQRVALGTNVPTSRDQSPILVGSVEPGGPPTKASECS